MRKVILIAGIGLLLAGCGSESGTIDTEDGEVTYEVDRDGENAEYRMTNEDGDEVVINSGSDVAVSLPDGFSLYPGAQVITNTTVNQADGSGSMVVMRSDDTPDEMAAYYRRQAEGAGVEIQMEMSSNGSKLIGGEGPDGLTFSFNATPDPEGTTAQLVVGRDNN
ncbi:hypothetical protein OZN62_04710 [Aurantiacibacter sp. MUD11]|uniref:hypothetical protein n=1 Tax=Aurantiacibacter sp. MUD11 TaxID=3003265 RepID=UPI0022AA126A|nr:hypothetical protein [Aurantiacibacter sp. MUD11]WAT18875.1 hypothetical protein OZN62_04710 [Aurantiacibacter sp. MUD11]